MTNGEKIKEIFPNLRVILRDSCVQVMDEDCSFCNAYTLEWWNAEYEEPTIRNCFGCKYSKDNHNSGTEECHLCMWENQYTPTTKNDLAVDCISRADARSLICKIDRKYMFNMSGKAFQDLYKGIDDLPSVIPFSSGLDKNSKKLEKDFGESDCISRKQAIDAFPDLLPNMGYNKKAITEILQELPSVTPQLSAPEVTALAEWTAKLTKASEDAYNKGYEDGMKAQEPILDKIRAEIEKLQKMCDKNDLNLMAQYSAFGMVLDILDKYKAESEE